MAPEFTFTCTPELFEQLIANDLDLLYSIEDASGIARRFMTYWNDSYRLKYSEIQYYPGCNVISAVRTGQLNKLNGDELELYTLAQEIVDEARAASEDTLSLEKYLHDEICRRTRYYTYESDELTRKDTAIGALIDGLAECDGYADAFYLLGNLAGFNVRYVHGQTTSMGSHLWNIVHLNDEWFAMDVTWDDFEADNYAFAPYYIYFNIGADRLSATHSWYDDALLEPIAQTTGIPNYYNAVNGVCDSWSDAGGYIAWRLEQGQVTDSIMMPNFQYDNDALHNAICNALPSSWKSWSSWYKNVGNDLYINYYIVQ